MDAVELLGVVGACVAIAGGIQALGNRSMRRNIQADIGAPLARIEERAEAHSRSLDEHKRTTERSSMAQQIVLEEIRKETRALDSRVAVVEDRTARLIGSGDFERFKERK